jgi:hypothetical protein
LSCRLLPFHRAIQSAFRLRDSTVPEVERLLCVYVGGLWLWQNRVSFDIATCYAKAVGRRQLTPAGFW